MRLDTSRTLSFLLGVGRLQHYTGDRCLGVDDHFTEIVDLWLQLAGRGDGTVREREFFIDNLLVRIHFIIEMIWWTGLVPWEFEFPFPGSRTSLRSLGTGMLRNLTKPSDTVLYPPPVGFRDVFGSSFEGSGMPLISHWRQS